MEITKYKKYQIDLLDMNNRSPLITALALVSLNILSLLLLIMTFSVLNSDNPFLMMTLPTVVSFIIIPKLFLKYMGIEDRLDTKKYIKSSLAIFICFSVVYIYIFKSKFEMSFISFWIINYIFVSIGEEYIYRHLLINLLAKKLNIVLSVVISSLVFAFILHNNESFITNLCYRLPLALVLSSIYVKTESLSLPVFVHTIYNLMVMVI